MSITTSLRPWTDLARPHPDVQSGDFQMGTFAANLAAVAFGEEATDVYADPREFFRSTYFTTAMRSILEDVCGALAGHKGDRVIQLITPFGGGKTHSLLAIYHLAKHREAAAVAPELDGLPDPGAVRIAVLSGEHLDPQRGRVVDGRTIRTLWGELAYQLGGWEAYDSLLVDGDEGTPPGGEWLGKLLRTSPALILLDEVLIYVVKGKGAKRGETTAGTQAKLFLQNLTEAINHQPNTAMVYSLQASIGEAVGEEAELAQLQKLSARIDVRREPVSGDEVLLVVQRRLFADLPDEAARRDVARVYGEQLKGHLTSTAETDGDRADAARAAANLERRIIDAYPFHPELIDLMHHRWGSLPDYQRTRGALQFLATVISALYRQRGERAPGALIGPGDVDLSDQQTRATFLEQVGETNSYTAVLEADFIASDAGTKAIDIRIGRVGPALERLRVGTRVATAIMLLSFGARQGDERGATEREVIEASLVPDLDANIVREGLQDMRREALLYLHHANGRYRFDTVPNVNKLVRSEADAIDGQAVLDSVRQQLERALGTAARGHAVVWPASPDQLPDEPGAYRIAYLPPDQPSDLDTVRKYAGTARGGAPRRFLNAVGFAVPSSGGLDSARRAARTLLAVERLLRRGDRLQLSREQREDLDERARNARKEMDGGLRTAYERVLLPARLGDDGVEFEDVDLRATLASGRALHERIREALEIYVFDSVEPSRISRVADLANRDFAWCETVAEAVYSFYESPRLWTLAALRKGIAKGVERGTFGYASGCREEGGELVLPAPSALKIGGTIGDDVDLGPGTSLLSLALVERLKPAVGGAGVGSGGAAGGAGGPAVPGGPSAGGPGTGGGPAGPGGVGGRNGEPGPGGGTPPATRSRVRLQIGATEADLFALNRALSALRDLVAPGSLRLRLEVEADGQGRDIDRVDYANRVREPLDEASGITVQEFWPDESA